MKRLTFAALAGVLGIGMSLISPSTAVAQRQAPPGGSYKLVSSLVPLPDFVPGLGVLYVDPATLPAGPFLGYDREGRPVSSIYMIPLKDLNARRAFTNLAVGPGPVDHVDVVFNPGHAGVAEPHYHVILWYVSAERAAQLAE